MDYFKESLKLHEEFKGKLSVHSKVPLSTKEDLSLAYTPGVAAPCQSIAENPEDAYKYTIKSNTVAVVTDGSAVLGLGDIGPLAGLPVMEGKCLLFKHFGKVDAFPICIDSKDTEEIINVVKKISPVFGGINLEDIKAPRCFEIEKRLNEELDIPVFHDDQHGTAIVVLAALINAIKVRGLELGNIKIVVSGAGAAGNAVTKLLSGYGAKNIIVLDSKGALTEGRPDLAEMPYKDELAKMTNPEKICCSIADVIKGADVFVGVSSRKILTEEMVKSMNKDPIIFAMANPIPEIMPDEALAAGAYIVGTGRSDFPNQINNVLAFPGIFRGALDCGAKDITLKMKIAAAEALAGFVKNPEPEKVIPSTFEKGLHGAVAEAVKKCEE